MRGGPYLRILYFLSICGNISLKKTTLIYLRAELHFYPQAIYWKGRFQFWWKPGVLHGWCIISSWSVLHKWNRPKDEQAVSLQWGALPLLNHEDWHVGKDAAVVSQGLFIFISSGHLQLESISEGLWTYQNSSAWYTNICKFTANANITSHALLCYLL